MGSSKISWWQLYALVPLMLVLLGVEQFKPAPGMAPDLVDIGIVALAFGAMLGWVNINAGRLEWYFMQKEKFEDELHITVYAPKSGATDEYSNDAFRFEIPNSAMASPAGRQERKDVEKWQLN